jgi:hypothetical protein
MTAKPSDQVFLVKVFYTKVALCVLKAITCNSPHITLATHVFVLHYMYACVLPSILTDVCTQVDVTSY